MRKLSVFVLTFILSTILFAQNSNKPIIGISSSWGEGTSTSVSLTYIESVKLAGGIPLVIPIIQDNEMLKAILDRIDAVIMTGGEDIDPLKWYGEEPVNAMGGIAPERDSYDIALIRLAVERNMPVLGICRGHQIMNVAFGGTLYQDIPSQKAGSNLKHNQRAPGNYGTHSIKIIKGSQLNLQTGLDSVAVNSFHHQAVKDIAPGFIVTAVASDGIIEAIEKVGSTRVFGVQFHPEEFTAGGIDTFLGVFKHLVSEANAYRGIK